MSHDTDDKNVKVVGGGKIMQPKTEQQLKKGVKIQGGRRAPETVEILSKNEE